MTAAPEHDKSGFSTNEISATRDMMEIIKSQLNMVESQRVQVNGESVYEIEYDVILRAGGTESNKAYHAAAVMRLKGNMTEPSAEAIPFLESIDRVQFAHPVVLKEESGTSYLEALKQLFADWVQVPERLRHIKEHLNQAGSEGAKLMEERCK